MKMHAHRLKPCVTCGIDWISASPRIRMTVALRRRTHSDRSTLRMKSPMSDVTTATQAARFHWSRMYAYRALPSGSGGRRW